jgi:hypothetical protein
MYRDVAASAQVVLDRSPEYGHLLEGAAWLGR